MSRFHKKSTPKLSVNVNKIALLRNQRDHGFYPDLKKAVQTLIESGAQGITVHPRPDERHITYDDVRMLSDFLTSFPYVEFNIEGYPSSPFLDLCIEAKPHQVTLVPDPPHAKTSDHGFSMKEHESLLKKSIQILKQKDIRISAFFDPDLKELEQIPENLLDRVELYTGPFAFSWENKENMTEITKKYENAATLLNTKGICINAGHDLNLDNLGYFLEHVPFIEEVSIGHAFIANALWDGLALTTQKYLSLTKGVA